MSDPKCKIVLIKKVGKMIATALKIQEATQDAVLDFSTMIMAREIFKDRAILTEEEFANKIFEYSCHLSSLTATLVSNACLTEEQIVEMVKTIKEFKKMEEDVKNGNN